MAYFDDEEDEMSDQSNMVDLADDSFNMDKFGERLVRRDEEQGQVLEREFDAMPTPAPEKVKPAATKQIQGSKEKYSGLMDEYKALQEKRNKNYMNLAIVDSLSQMGQAIAGKNAFGSGFKVKSNMDMFEKMANRPVDDYQDKVKQEGLDISLRDERSDRDANSEVARQAREMAKSRGYPVTDAMSKRDIVEMMKLGDPLKEQGQRQQLDIGTQALEKGTMGINDERTMRDPNSSISEFYRTMAGKRGFTPEQVSGKSAWEIQGMSKIMPKPTSTSKQFQTKNITDANGNIVKTVVFDTSTGQVINDIGTAGFAQRAIEDKRTGEMVNYNPALGRSTSQLTSPTAQSPEQAQTAIPEITKEQLPVNKQKQLDEYRKQFLDDTKDDRTALQASRSIKGLLASGKKLDGDILRAVQNKFARATGERGAMTEQDVSPYGGKQAVVDRIGRSMSMWSTGKIPDEDRKFLDGLADLMQRQTERDLAQRTQFFSNNLYNDLKADPNVRASNFTAKSVEKLLGSDIYNDPNASKVEVISAKTGKKFMIDAGKVEEARAKGLIK